MPYLRPKKKPINEAQSKVTPLEEKFLSAYTDIKRPETYYNSASSMKHAAEECGIPLEETPIPSRVMKNKRVQKALRDILATTTFKGLIYKRLFDILNNDFTRPRDVIAAIDIWAKITGEYAPEKHINMNLTPEERDNKYTEIMNTIRKAQSSPTTPPPIASQTKSLGVVDTPEGPYAITQTATLEVPPIDDTSFEEEDEDEEEADFDTSTPTT